jgi:hypothetical protein
MRLTAIAVGTLFSLVPIVTMGEQPRASEADEKPAWKWTQEERVAARVNPRSQGERRERARALGQEMSEKASIVMGSVEPELFIPAELFEFFITTVFVEHAGARASWRGDIDTRYSGHLPDDFWERLGRVTHDLQARLSSERELGRKLTTADAFERERISVRIDEVRVEKCTLFREALGSARALLPAGEFDRLLYEAVAPNIVKTEPASSEALMLRLERGC